MRFGAGAMSLVWIDISALFSILLDARNLYGEWGCNDYALSLSSVVLYCALWTLILYPLTLLDEKDITISISKNRLFSVLCVFLIICTIIYVLGTGAFSNIIEKLSMARHEAYSDSMDMSEIYKSKGQFLLWIPLVVSHSWPLLLLCWFVSFCVCVQSWWIRMGLLISSLFMMISAYAGGGRAQLVWWIITFFIYFFLFLPNMNKQQKIMGFGMSTIAGIGIIVGILSITLSRFDSSAQDYALNSIIGYAGQSLNNFCAVLPYTDLSHIYLDRTFPLTNLLINHQIYNLHDYYDFLSSYYPLQVNVFFTVFGCLLMDIGWLGLMIYLTVYILVFKYIFLNTDSHIDMSRLCILTIMICFPVRGIFGFPFSGHMNTLYILLSIGLYLLFKYHVKYGNKTIL
jgi:oligosaccharide repeat unit polymerase